MLIDDAIEAAKAAGRLIPAQPVVPWVGQPRAFLMCRPLYQAITVGKNDVDENIRKRWAKLEAAISHFIEGGYITENLLKHLLDKKNEHWEMINRRPRPSLRVFGRFAKPDVFIGTHVCYRKQLGGMWSPEFEHEKLVCEDHWEETGLPKPFSAPPNFEYERYITDNASRRSRV